MGDVVERNVIYEGFAGHIMMERGVTEYDAMGRNECKGKRPVEQPRHMDIHERKERLRAVSGWESRCKYTWDAPLVKWVRGVLKQ